MTMGDADTETGQGLLLLSIVSKQQLDLERLFSKVEALETRNLEKDFGKKFEGSWTRVACIILLTYFIIYLYLKYSLNVDDAAKNAVVPALGFTMSTWSMSLIKPIWRRLTGLSVNLRKNDNQTALKPAPPAPPLPLC
jgi:hypothetical protein